MRTSRLAAMVIVVLLASGACVTAEAPAERPAWLSKPLPREYLLEVGDVLDVKLFYHPELNEAAVTVRPDGKISLQLVGDVEARGRTPSQLSAGLAEAYAKEGLRQPRVSAILRKSAGLRVFVSGEVGNPGMVPHEGLLTLSQAITQAGGAKNTANLETVVLLRDSGTPGEPLFTVVDVRDTLSGGLDVLLQPYDVVFVPKSTIAKMNQFVDQYIVKLIPITFTAGFSYTLGKVTTPIH